MCGLDFRYLSPHFSHVAYSEVVLEHLCISPVCNTLLHVGQTLICGMIYNYYIKGGYSVSFSTGHVFILEMRHS